MPALRHVCLVYHFEANGTEKQAEARVIVQLSNFYGTHPKARVQYKTNQTKSLLLSSYEFKRPLYSGAWCRDLFLLPEDADGLLREAKPPRADGTAARVGTDRPPSPAAARVREGTTFPEVLPLLVGALLPPPPFVFPVPPVLLLLLLLVLGTELAPAALCCGRLLDIIQGRLETPQIRCVAIQSIRKEQLFGYFSRFAS